MDPKRFLSCLLLLTLFSACHHDSQTVAFNKEYLYGRWELTQGWRNQKKTEMLVGTYYEFDRNGHARTNFNQEMSDKDFEYEIKGATILLNGDSESLLHIDSLSGSTLIFNVDLHSYNFKMILAKKEGTEEEREL